MRHRRAAGNRRGVLGILRGLLSRRPHNVRRGAQPCDNRRSNGLAVDPGESNDGIDVGPLIDACLDEEAGTLPRRRFVRDTAHAMWDAEQTEEDPGEQEDGDDHNNGEATSSYSREDIERLLQEREQSKSLEEQQQDIRNKQYSMDRILMCSRNPQELMRLADTHIDEDWLGKIDEMPGNIYRIAAFGGLTVDSLQNLARWLGASTIFLVQLFGPPLVCISSTGWGVAEDKSYKWQNWTERGDTPWSEHLLSDWQEFPVPKLLSVFFIFLFSLNGLFVIADEKKCWSQMDCMLRYLNRETPKFEWQGEWMLYLDALMNNWIVVWCTIDSFLLVGNSRTVQDVLFDALSLLFLYNLDDIAGDLGFVNDDDWDGLRLGWIYDQMVVPRFVPERRRNFRDDIDEETEDVEASYVFLCLYDMSTVLLAIASFVLPIVSIFTPFGKIGPDD